MSSTPTENPISQDERTILERYEEEFNSSTSTCNAEGCSQTATWVQVHDQCKRYYCTLHKYMSELFLQLYLQQDGTTKCFKCHGDITSFSQVSYKPL